MRSRAGRIIVIVIALLVAWLGSSVRPSRTGAQVGASYGGRATAARVQVPATGTTFSFGDSGPLSASGGGVGSEVLSASVPGGQTAGLVSLAAGPLHAATIGLLSTDAEASLADVTLTISGIEITVGFLMARSSVSCDRTPAVAGRAQLANLVVNGQPIAITGMPNQTVSLPNGSVIINEQSASAGRSGAHLTVNALHVTTLDPITRLAVADVVLATADAAIQCQPGSALSAPPAWAQSTQPEFATGGGWIFVGEGKATFGFFAGTDGTGHLVYDDHDVDLIIESTSMTSVTADCHSTIHAAGIATTGGTTQEVTFQVDVTDAGEPGRNDTFAIQVDSLFYGRAGTLGGGNIEVDGSFAGGKVLAHGRAC
jgi:hypothetical protein